MTDLTLNDKKFVVTNLKTLVNQSLSMLLVDYSGLKAVDMVDLRAKARKENVVLKVVRNTLAKKSI